MICRRVVCVFFASLSARSPVLCVPASVRPHFASESSPNKTQWHATRGEGTASGEAGGGVGATTVRWSQSHPPLPSPPHLARPLFPAVCCEPARGRTHFTNFQRSCGRSAGRGARHTSRRTTHRSDECGVRHRWAHAVESHAAAGVLVGVGHWHHRRTHTHSRPTVSSSPICASAVVAASAPPLNASAPPSNSTLFPHAERDAPSLVIPPRAPYIAPSPRFPSPWASVPPGPPRLPPRARCSRGLTLMTCGALEREVGNIKSDR